VDVFHCTYFDKPIINLLKDAAYCPQYKNVAKYDFVQYYDHSKKRWVRFDKYSGRLEVKVAIKKYINTDVLTKEEFEKVVKDYGEGRTTTTES
jgi:hypothetical protein